MELSFAVASRIGNHRIAAHLPGIGQRRAEMDRNREETVWHYVLFPCKSFVVEWLGREARRTIGRIPCLWSLEIEYDGWVLSLPDLGIWNRRSSGRRCEGRLDMPKDGDYCRTGFDLNRNDQQ